MREMRSRTADFINTPITKQKTLSDLAPTEQLIGDRGALGEGTRGITKLHLRITMSADGREGESERK